MILLLLNSLTSQQQVFSSVPITAVSNIADTESSGHTSEPSTEARLNTASFRKTKA